MINDAILAALQVNATTGISANLVDNLGGAVKVFHRVIPQGENLGCVAYRALIETPVQVKSGRKMDEILVSFTVRHKDDYKAKSLAYNLRDILEAWNGVHGSDRWGRVILDKISEGFEPFHGLHTVVADFQFSL